MTAAVMQPLPMWLPHLGPEVREAADRALAAGYLGLGSLSRQFEEALAGHLELDEDRKLMTTNSCTAALNCACILAGAGPDTEVIAPAFTYVAAHQAITATGADIVFCDVEEPTLTVDPDKLSELIGPRTRAIMVCNFAGLVGRLEEVYALAAEHGLRMIEDAAHALGTRYQDRMVGASGDLVCYRNQRAWQYDVTRLGFRYHLGAVQSAIGLAQLAPLEEFVVNRQAYCRGYNERLAGIPEVITPPSDYKNIAPFIYFIRVPAGARAELVTFLEARGIPAGIHFQAAHDFTFYSQAKRGDLSVTDRVSREELTLPLWSYMDEAVLDRVSAGVAAFFGG
jgi:dTDP-4-amino-4,6-dideoxygalactose transaminase